jgi:2-polyprenyl-3-methyl-5-hydroxy-6-metoxy-1,4-benzoquinol methylase
LEAVQGVFDLTKAVPQNQAQVTGSSPITITTDEHQWWYAAAFRLQPKALRNWPSDARLLIRVEGAVQTGQVGLAFVADDMKKILSTTDEKSPAHGDATFTILVDPAPRSGWLILRNTAPSGKASRCELRAIQTFQAGPEPPQPTSRLTEVTDFNASTIDMTKLAAAAASAGAENSDDSFLEALRRKWSEVPTTRTMRLSTADMARMSDEELWALWSRVAEETTTGEGYSVRGWYHDLYRDILRGKRVLDVGSGFGVDGLTFARAGAQITFLDVVRGNLVIVERLCHIAHVSNVRFHYLEDLSSLDALTHDFDVIWCLGSMLHAPFSFSRREAAALLRRLPVGGRWIELAYPRERWVREGSLPFSEWGKITDGERTPWAEWYDLKRLRMRLEPAEFDVLLHFNLHQDDFNWFDLIRRK